MLFLSGMKELHPHIENRGNVQTESGESIDCFGPYKKQRQNQWNEIQKFSGSGGFENIPRWDYQASAYESRELKIIQRVWLAI